MNQKVKVWVIFTTRFGVEPKAFLQKRLAMNHAGALRKLAGYKDVSVQVRETWLQVSIGQLARAEVDAGDDDAV